MNIVVGMGVWYLIREKRLNTFDPFLANAPKMGKCFLSCRDEFGFAFFQSSFVIKFFEKTVLTAIYRNFLLSITSCGWCYTAVIRKRLKGKKKIMEWNEMTYFSNQKNSLTYLCLYLAQCKLAHSNTEKWLFYLVLQIFFWCGAESDFSCCGGL